MVGSEVRRAALRAVLEKRQGQAQPALAPVIATRVLTSGCTIPMAMPSTAAIRLAVLKLERASVVSKRSLDCAETALGAESLQIAGLLDPLVALTTAGVMEPGVDMADAITAAIGYAYIVGALAARYTATADPFSPAKMPEKAARGSVDAPRVTAAQLRAARGEESRCKPTPNTVCASPEERLERRTWTEQLFRVSAVKSREEREAAHAAVQKPSAVGPNARCYGRADITLPWSEANAIPIF